MKKQKVLHANHHSSRLKIFFMKIGA